MDNIGLMLFFAILPVILILIFVYSKDKTKEPLALLLHFFILGIVSCFLVIAISQILGLFLPFMQGDLESKDFLDIILYSFIGVALVEEVCKWLMLYSKGYNNKEYDEIYDIIVYSVFVSLGFAFYENIIYIFYSEAGNLQTAIMRAISAVPGHACDAVFMGYYLTLAKQLAIQNKKELERKNIVLSIVIPTLLHGIYDFCLISNEIFVYIFIIFVTFLYSISLNKLKEISQENHRLRLKHFCIACGTKLEGPFCSNCGRRQE